MDALRDGYDDRSRLVNGRFLHNLNGWMLAGGAYYAAGSGDEQYGVAALPNGASISQQFAVDRGRTYTLHLFVLPPILLTGAEVQVTLRDQAGNLLLAHGCTGTLGAWTDNTFTVGLVPGGSYTLTITNVSAGNDAKIDDVWLWWVPLTRAQLAARVHDKLGRLATDRSYTTTASGTLTEGSYTYAVDAGLRAVGAICPETDQPDVRYLETALVDTVLDAIEREMIEKLQRDYALEVDVQAGPRRESYSQIGKALARLNTGLATGAPGRVVVRTLKHTADEYELGG